MSSKADNWKYWRNTIAFFIFAASAGAGLFIVGIYGEGFARTDEKRWLYVLGGSLAVTAVLSTFLENHMAERARSKARERAIAVKAEMTLLYTQILLPATQHTQDQIAGYISQWPRDTTADVATRLRFESFLRQLLEAAVELIGPAVPPSTQARARAAFYMKDSSGNYDLKMYSPPHANPPRSQILGSTPEGSHISTMILGTPPKPWIVDGKTSTIGPGSTPNISYMKQTSINSYEAVIAAPVACNGKSFGMLSVDTPDSEVFIKEHRDLILALAGVIAANLLLVES